MAASTAGMIKALLEGSGLGVPVYRDAAPRDTQQRLPYITVTERISATPDRDGTYDAGVAHTVVEQAQVDVWQAWRSLDTGRSAESLTLPGDVERALHGALPGGLTPWRVYGLRVLSSTRLLEEESNVVHHAITVAVHRER